MSTKALPDKAMTKSSEGCGPTEFCLHEVVVMKDASYSMGLMKPGECTNTLFGRCQ
jgi:hypothetical protein